MENNIDSLKREAYWLRESWSKEPMSIIALLGKKNCGKTTTLSRLIILLTGGGVLDTVIESAFDKKFKKANGLYKDSHHIIHYKNSEGKEACIYVSTNGDTWTVVENNFKFFYGLCDWTFKVYEFDYSKKEFVKRSPLKDTNPPRPDLCISPANYFDGAIHAEHYFLSNTILDWKRQLWIRKEKIKNKKSKDNEEEVKDNLNKNNRFRSDNERVIDNILEEINRMI